MGSTKATTVLRSRTGDFVSWIIDGPTRRVWVILLFWALLWSVIHIPNHGWSWHFVATGVNELFSPRPMSLYAAHPELQMGPLTFLVSAPFVLLLRDQLGEIFAMGLLTGLGVLLVREIRLLTGASSGAAARRWLLAALLILPAWAEVAVHWGHVDDAAALFCGVVGLRLVRGGHPLASAAMFALAVDFKPWAIPLAAVLILAPRRQWLRAAAIWVAIVALAWAPFVLGDPGTIGITRFAIPIDPASTLRVLGIAGDVTPSWDRYAQLGIAVALAVIAVARRRWASAFLIVFAVRLLLDPATKNYYDVGLAVGAGIFDALLTTGVLPLMTITSVALVYLPSYVLLGAPVERGVTRTVALVGLVVAALVLPRARAYGAEPSRSEIPGVSEPTALG